MGPAKEKQSSNIESFQVIALDGGAASGKSSTARALAQQFDLLHCDTGEHYRALTCCLLEAKVKPQAAEVEAFLAHLKADILIEGRQAHICLNGTCFERALLKSPEVNDTVSGYAAVPCLRRWLLAYQRSHVELARQKGFKGLIMEGRDVGSVVLPDANHVFFLEADTAIRQQRRSAEGAQDSIQSRDKQDSSRQAAPLKKSPRAQTIDTTHQSLKDVVAWIGLRIQSS